MKPITDHATYAVAEAVRYRCPEIAGLDPVRDRSSIITSVAKQGFIRIRIDQRHLGFEFHGDAPDAFQFLEDIADREGLGHALDTTVTDFSLPKSVTLLLGQFLNGSPASLGFVPQGSSDLIHFYSRAQALADGVLVDVTEWASADRDFLGGFKLPVAVTAAVWHDLNAIPDRLQGVQDVRGRAHDLLFMASLAAWRNLKADSIIFEVLLDLGRSKRQRYRLTVGPGDHGEPVITILRTDED